MNIPTLERRDFIPEAAFRLDLRRQLDALAPLAAPSRARQPLAGTAAPAFTPERRQPSSIVFPKASPAGALLDSPLLALAEGLHPLGLDPTARQPFMNIPTLERRDFIPEAAFRLDLRRQLDALAPLAAPSRARQPLAGTAAPAFTPERRQPSSIVFPEASPAGQCAVVFLHVDDFWPSA
ncbi:UNVERIFIED_CONTAM: hypothetical protein K2H54_001240 [Gekko kuhli]